VGEAEGVRVIDSKTKETTEYAAKVIFLNAGAINSVALLQNSTSGRFVDGLGNDSGTLGKYVAFHNYRAKINAIHDGHKDKAYKGGIPTSGYMPRFRNVYKQETDFLRGYACGFNAQRWKSTPPPVAGLGQELTDSIVNVKRSYTGPWQVGSHMMGATIPKESNYIKLSPAEKDEWGMPLIKISMDYDDNDEKMILDFFEQMTEMYTKAGFVEIKTRDTKQAPGLDIHEMGGIRMGHDPKTSMLTINSMPVKTSMSRMELV